MKINIEIELSPKEVYEIPQYIDFEKLREIIRGMILSILVNKS